MFLLALSLSALAQSPSSEPVILIPAVQELTEGEFDLLNVEGRLLGPATITSSERRAARFPSWVQLRQDFQAELRDSLTELK